MGNDTNRLQERLNSYQENPRDDAWDAIEAGLKAESKQKLFVRLSDLVTLVLLLASTAFFTEWQSKDTSTLALSKNIEKPNLTKTPIKSEAPIKLNSKTKLKTKFHMPNDKTYSIATNEKNEKLKSNNLTFTRSIVKGLPFLGHPILLTNPLDSLLTIRNDAIKAILKADKRKDSLGLAQFPKRSSAMYLIVTPNLGYQIASPNIDDDVLIDGFKNDQVISSKRIGFKTEIGWQKEFGNIHWQIGLLHIYRNQHLAYSKTYQDSVTFSIVGSESILIQPKKKEYVVSNSLNSIGLATSIFYNWQKSRYSHGWGIGVEFQQSVSHNSNLGIGSQYLFFNLNYKLEYKLSKNLLFMLQPGINYAIFVNNQKAEPFYITPYQVGLGVGFLRKF